MSDAHWKNALWKLLEVLPLRRFTARVALSAGLIGLASQPAAGTDAGPRVPVTPVLTPEATVRKFKGKYVLERAANSFVVRFAGHRSHSSHSSHRSHSSSSHYSGAHSSHFSSSTAPPARSVPSTPESAPEPRPKAIEPPPSPKAETLLSDEFATSERAEHWTIGVLATPLDTFDANVTTEQTLSTLSITPLAQQPGAHFSGYVSTRPFDLKTSSIAVELRRPARGAITIFAVAIDAANWIGFRVENDQLLIESHTKGRVTSRKIAYSATEHRFLRLRTSKVAPVAAVAVWETSADGRSWYPQYVETSGIQLTALRIVLSAGTTSRVASAEAATFDHVTVERQP